MGRATAWAAARGMRAAGSTSPGRDDCREIAGNRRRGPGTRLMSAVPRLEARGEHRGAWGTSSCRQHRGVQPQGDIRPSRTRPAGTGSSAEPEGRMARHAGLRCPALERGEGRIVDVASLAADTGLLLAAYTASKAGVAGLTARRRSSTPCGHTDQRARARHDRDADDHRQPAGGAPGLSREDAGRAPGAAGGDRRDHPLPRRPGRGIHQAGQTISVDGGWGIRG